MGGLAYVFYIYIFFLYISLNFSVQGPVAELLVTRQIQHPIVILYSNTKVG